jgi:hypothetical protein
MTFSSRNCKDLVMSRRSLGARKLLASSKTILNREHRTASRCHGLKKNENGHTVGCPSKRNFITDVSAEEKPNLEAQLIFFPDVLMFLAMPAAGAALTDGVRAGESGLTEALSEVEGWAGETLAAFALTLALTGACLDVSRAGLTDEAFDGLPALAFEEPEVLAADFSGMIGFTLFVAPLTGESLPLLGAESLVDEIAVASVRTLDFDFTLAITAPDLPLPPFLPPVTSQELGPEGILSPARLIF